jgi:rubredoxin
MNREKLLGMARTGLRRTLDAVYGALWHREPSRQVCPECKVDFAPALTDHRCPVCGWVAAPDPAAIPAMPARRVREAAGLGLAWFVAIVAFALLAHALYA